MAIKPRIIFMGTPDFAVPTLEILSRNFNVIAVVTAPDKPAGRGLTIHESAVKKKAMELDIPVLQPVKLKDPEFLDALKSLKADLQVVVAFRMLPEAVWQMPPMGTFNLHASLLPHYRGAAPINWAIINGEKITGVTTFFLKHEIDTGDLLLQEEVPIGENETAGELHDRLMIVGSELVNQTVEGILSGDLKGSPQKTITDLKTAPKIFRETCKIGWSKDVETVHNLIRGLSPYPAAWTIADGKVLKIYRSLKQYSKHSIEPGTVIQKSGSLIVAVMEGFIEVLELQLEGKKKMSAGEFLKGNKLPVSLG